MRSCARGGNASKCIISKLLGANPIFETNRPIEDFPEPIIPKKTRFFFNFIKFCIEKPQICLNLKISKVICNLLKKQVRAKILLA